MIKIRRPVDGGGSLIWRFDLMAIPFKDKSFDLVICNHVLEHVEDDQKAMDEIYRILKAGSPNIDAIITSDEHDALSQMSRNVMANKDARTALDEIVAEFTLSWTDESYGAAKGRCDGLKRNAIIEYKTAGTIDEKSFFSQSVKLGYDIACGWYMHGAQICNVVENPVFIFIVQEAKFPWDVAVYQAPQQMIDTGYSKAKSIAAKYRQCESTGIFTGVQIGGMKVLDVPEWYGGDVELEGVEQMESEDVDG